jgi:transcription elongation factor Elf1
MNEKCKNTGKSRLTRNDAKQLIRYSVELHHYYKCDHCGTFHVSSDNSKKQKRKYKPKK